MGAGTLFVVATPIGNLRDITLRALDTLKGVDAVVCEDTRHTRKLLSHYGIDVKLESHFAGNETRRVPALVEAIREGRSLALVTDAGTPAISDPGYLLVRACRDAGLPVVPIPGASAMATALSASGLPSTTVKFLGFAPRKSGERRSLFAALAAEASTLVFYESPHRVRAFLAEARLGLPGRACVVAREVTKAFESFYRDPAPEELPEKGEFVLLFGPPEAAPAPSAEPLSLRNRVGALVASGLPEREALRQAAKEFEVPRRTVYDAVKGKGRETDNG